MRKKQKQSDILEYQFYYRGLLCLDMGFYKTVKFDISKAKIKNNTEYSARELFEAYVKCSFAGDLNDFKSFRFDYKKRKYGGQYILCEFITKTMNDSVFVEFPYIGTLASQKTGCPYCGLKKARVAMSKKMNKKSPHDTTTTADDTTFKQGTS